MPLPILQYRPRPSSHDLVRLFHQTESRWIQHLAEPHPLNAGTAYANAALASVQDANNIRDAALAVGVSPRAALEQAAAHYARLGTRCCYWIMSPSVPEARTAPLAEHLLATGHSLHSVEIMMATPLPGPAPDPAPGLTIVPARASFRHSRQLFDEWARCRGTPQLADAAMLHLDDPHWDALLALRNGQAVGYVGVLAVGEAGRIDQLYVAPPHRREGIGQTMMVRALEVCARSLFRYVMLSVLPDNTAAVHLYRKLGFCPIGQATAYLAPGLSPA